MSSVDYQAMRWNPFTDQKMKRLLMQFSSLKKGQFPDLIVFGVGLWTIETQQAEASDVTRKELREMMEEINYISSNAQFIIPLLDPVIDENESKPNNWSITNKMLDMYNDFLYNEL